MSGEINRTPLGLLSLLDMKARGQSPRLLSSETQLGIESLNLYGLQSRRRLRSVTAAIAVPGTSYPITVPQNEIWVLLALTLSSATLAAGTTYRLSPAARANNDDGTVGEHMLSPPLSFTVGENVKVSGVYPDGLWLQPGTQLGAAFVAVTVGTAVTFQVFTDAIVLPV